MSFNRRDAGAATRGRGLARPSAVIVALVVAVLVAACGGAAPTPAPIMVEPVTMPPLGQRETAYTPPVAAPALVLTDQDGKAFDLASLRGGPVFVYFGYTHCPDICPTTLADIRAALGLAKLPAKVVFVTIDPARDTPAAMKQYVDAYSSGFIGLSGTAEQIATAAGAWGVAYQAGPADSRGNYPMSHSTDTYLVDGSGMLRHHIFFGASSELIARLLAEVSAG